MHKAKSINEYNNKLSGGFQDDLPLFEYDSDSCSSLSIYDEYVVQNPSEKSKQLNSTVQLKNKFRPIDLNLERKSASVPNITLTNVFSRIDTVTSQKQMNLKQTITSQKQMNMKQTTSMKSKNDDSIDENMFGDDDNENMFGDDNDENMFGDDDDENMFSDDDDDNRVNVPDKKSWIQGTLCDNDEESLNENEECTRKRSNYQFDVVHRDRSVKKKKSGKKNYEYSDSDEENETSTSENECPGNSLRKAAYASGLQFLKDNNEKRNHSDTMYLQSNQKNLRNKRQMTLSEISEQLTKQQRNCVNTLIAKKDKEKQRHIVFNCSNPGEGKTLTTLAYYVGGNFTKLVVFCPNQCKHHWNDWAIKFRIPIEYIVSYEEAKGKTKGKSTFHEIKFITKTSRIENKKEIVDFRWNEHGDNLLNDNQVLFVFDEFHHLYIQSQRSEIPKIICQKLRTRMDNHKNDHSQESRAIALSGTPYIEYPDMPEVMFSLFAINHTKSNAHNNYQITNFNSTHQYMIRTDLKMIQMKIFDFIVKFQLIEMFKIHIILELFRAEIYGEFSQRTTRSNSHAKQKSNSKMDANQRAIFFQAIALNNAVHNVHHFFDLDDEDNDNEDNDNEDNDNEDNDNEDNENEDNDSNQKEKTTNKELGPKFMTLMIKSKLVKDEPEAFEKYYLTFITQSNLTDSVSTKKVGKQVKYICQSAYLVRKYLMENNLNNVIDYNKFDDCNYRHVNIHELWSGYMYNLLINEEGTRINMEKRKNINGTIYFVPKQNLQNIEHYETTHQRFVELKRLLGLPLNKNDEEIEKSSRGIRKTTTNQKNNRIKQATLLTLKFNVQFNTLLAEYDRLLISYMVEKAVADLETFPNCKVIIVVAQLSLSFAKLKQMIKAHKKWDITLDLSVTKEADAKKVKDQFMKQDLTHRILIAPAAKILDGIDLDDKSGHYPRICYMTPFTAVMTNYVQFFGRFRREETKSDLTVQIFQIAECPSLPFINIGYDQSNMTSLLPHIYEEYDLMKFQKMRAVIIEDRPISLINVTIEENGTIVDEYEEYYNEEEKCGDEESSHEENSEEEEEEENNEESSEESDNNNEDYSDSEEYD